MNNIETQNNKGEIVMYQLNDMVKLDVRLEDETVWLTQAQMSQLFSVKENTVTLRESYFSDLCQQVFKVVLIQKCPVLHTLAVEHISTNSILS